MNIARHAFVQTCLNLLWLYGLAHVGPVRAVLLSEHADIVVLAVWSAVLKGKINCLLSLYVCELDSNMLHFSLILFLFELLNFPYVQYSTACKYCIKLYL